jgi:hypothetical protein
MLRAAADDITAFAGLRSLRFDQERPIRPDRFGTVPDLPWTTRTEMEPGSDG